MISARDASTEIVEMGEEQWNTECEWDICMEQ